MATVTIPRLPTEQEFWDWAGRVPVASRDTSFGPIRPWGTQRELIRVIFDALARDVHQVLVVKAGQVGASLAMQLLSLFWFFRYPGLQSVFVCDAEDNRMFFRDNLRSMSQAAPADSPAITMDNKHQMVWANGTRLFLNVSGPRTGRRLGVGRGFAFGHLTEVPLWDNPASMTYLRTRFSDSHPARLLVSEGTPRGRNWFYDLWDEAEASADIVVCFLGWWMREDNAFGRDTAEYRKYWDGRLRPVEQRWAKTIAARWKRRIAPEQWTWRRWYEAEKAGGDARLAEQEQGTLPETAFEATGLSFLGLDVLRACRRAVAGYKAPARYRYEFGRQIEDTQLKPTLPQHAALEVWEQPEAAIGYVVASVPAHSATPECSDNVSSVWRADRDWLEQVAEFSLDDDVCGMQPFAWVCVQMIASYRARWRNFIMEISGPGMGVFDEMQLLQSTGWGTSRRPAVVAEIGGMRHYVWRRPDVMNTGAAWQWKMSPDLRSWLLKRLRDQISNGRVIVRSPALLAEMERVRQIRDQFIPEGRVIADHRVVAAALAVEAWARRLRPLFARVQGPSRATSVQGRLVGNFFDALRARK